MAIARKTEAQLKAERLATYEAYLASPYLSLKHSSYFNTYETLLKSYVGRPITFVEIGVLNGGSLFMWREFLGQDARIIGVDLNPDAKRWEEHGFEIWVGDQSDPDFWSSFTSAVGSIDVCIDDGGHSNIQQIVTVSSLVPNINDGGVMIVEDTHASYMRQFGNPSRLSFVSFAFDIVNAVNGRFPGIKTSENSLREQISHVTFFESIVALHVDRTQCFVSQPTSNGGTTMSARDFRHHGKLGSGVADLRHRLFVRFESLRPDHPVRRLGAVFFSIPLSIQSKVTNRRSRKYFGS